jgi:hypothetical protein
MNILRKTVQQVGFIYKTSFLAFSHNVFPMFGSERLIPRSLKCGSSAICLLRLRVWTPPGASMSVFWECCVLSGRVLYVGPITRPEESYLAWSVWVWSWILGRGETLTHWWLYIDPWRKKNALFCDCCLTRLTNSLTVWESDGLLVSCVIVWLMDLAG